MYYYQLYRPARGKLNNDLSVLTLTSQGKLRLSRPESGRRVRVGPLCLTQGERTRRLITDLLFSSLRLLVAVTVPPALLAMHRSLHRKGVVFTLLLLVGTVTDISMQRSRERAAAAAPRKGIPANLHKPSTAHTNPGRTT